MSDAHQTTPTMPIEGGPKTAIPQTDIPHMGTSQASIPNPSIADAVQPAPQAAQQPTPQTPAPQAQASQTQPPQAQLQMPPLPPGVTQEAINAAIAQVQQTGATDGIAPEVLNAACAQLEAQAAAQGVDLNAPLPPGQQAPTAGPANYVEAAVMDKQGTIDAFDQQRESIRNQVADQRESMQQPFKEALNKVGAQAEEGAAIEPEKMAELAAAIRDLDPSTVALINALGFMSANPSILNSVVWIEIIRAFRRLVAKEVKNQGHDALHA